MFTPDLPTDWVIKLVIMFLSNLVIEKFTLLQAFILNQIN
ncbi:hypothetical protein MADA3029_80020 [Vibrio nigripulchritudo MADA3029]|nr:hypothetical protein VIBNIMADA3020_1130020 [Vibrio nigripulchritudo MADA3020]CCN52605.1 hypothetical protein VIBNIMADA3021_1290030 [Vibrio nigripulchritudo MADA3021]CCN61473.1 hypothetical protein MADA3029_80020 [Vibrio nigripulchritudo MADA3029]